LLICMTPRNTRNTRCVWLGSGGLCRLMADWTMRRPSPTTSSRLNQGRRARLTRDALVAMSIGCAFPPKPEGVRDRRASIFRNASSLSRGRTRKSQRPVDNPGGLPTDTDHYYYLRPLKQGVLRSPRGTRIGLRTRRRVGQRRVGAGVVVSANQERANVRTLAALKPASGLKLDRGGQVLRCWRF
jgi:hypothetical protein